MAAAYGHTRSTVVRGDLPSPARPPRGAGDRRLAEEKLAFFGQRLAGYRHDQPAYNLSYANRRRLEIARAMATNPRLLLLDEPAAGMNPAETHEITELIGRLQDEGGYTILVIEHDMHVVEGISDRVVALDHGVKIAEGSFEAGGDRPAGDRGVPGAPGSRMSLLRLQDVDTYYGEIHILQQLSLEVGEGRARLPARRQRLREVDDAEDDPRHRPAASRHGRARRRGRDRANDELPDRAGDGDRPGEPPPVRADDGAGEPRDGRLPRRRAASRRSSSGCLGLFPLLKERRKQLAGTLSGGEQQMVAMGRALMSRPKLLLMDEPSMGLAPILVERNFEIIKQVHEAGVAVLVVEQNANVSLSIADRGYVLQTGRIVLAGPRRRCLAERGPPEGLPWPFASRRATGRIRRRFPIFERLVYINCCSQGALSDAVRDSYEEYLRDWDDRARRGTTGSSAPRPRAPRSPS